MKLSKEQAEAVANSQDAGKALRDRITAALTEGTMFDTLDDVSEVLISCFIDAHDLEDAKSMLKYTIGQLQKALNSI